VDGEVRGTAFGIMTMFQNLSTTIMQVLWGRRKSSLFHPHLMHPLSFLGSPRLFLQQTSDILLLFHLLLLLLFLIK